MLAQDLAELSKSDLLNVLDVCHDAMQCTGATDLEDLLRKAALLLPSAAILAARLPAAPQASLEQAEVVNISYPAEWVSEYVRRNYLSIDPIKDRMAASVGKFVCNWERCFDESPQIQTQQFVKQLREYDLAAGMTFSLRRHDDAAVCFFSFASSEIATERRHGALLEYLLPYLHEAFRRSPAGAPIGLEQVEGADSPPIVEHEPVVLTPREKDVLSWAMYGKTNTDIAQLLNISERTAKFHVQNVLVKLGACSRAHAVAIALQRGLLTA